MNLLFWSVISAIIISLFIAIGLIINTTILYIRSNRIAKMNSGIIQMQINENIRNFERDKFK